MHLVRNLGGQRGQFVLRNVLPALDLELQRRDHTRRWFGQDDTEFTGHARHEAGDDIVDRSGIDHHALHFQHVVRSADDLVSSPAPPARTGGGEHLHDVVRIEPDQVQGIPG